jgi:glycyl-tRNA synthetase beta chain
MGLLEEVAGMVEWPAALIGDIAPEFLDLPPEVVRTTMRVHQRYFAVARPDGTLAPHFIAIANLETVDDGTLITAGNVRVLAARLSDARFFWSEDRRKPLEAWLEPLAGVVFHARLGPMADRVERLANLARWIAPHIGADPDEAARAGRLAKADLATGMVGEFPELQGIMGGYYAAASGESEAVAAAIADHYRPQGPSDRVPNAPVSIAVALADKVDLLATFFSIGEAPTGSRDPFGLRRAALGIIRIVTENRLSVSLRELFAASGYPDNGLEAFAADRLKGLLRDRGARHDLADAVLALGDDDCTRIVEKVEALTEFLANPAGADLLAAYRRAGNILDAEARKGPLPATEPGPAQGAEGAFFDAVRATRVAVHEALATADFRSALESLAELRAPIDRFFDEVLVNSPVSAERANRLSLLQAARAVMGEVADFARISV